MNVLKCAVVWCAAALCAAGVSFAHPPSGVTLKFDAASSRLIVEAPHAVKDGNSHYIERVKVSLNGKEIIRQDFSLQPDKQVQRAEYIVPGLTAGDELAAEAACSVYGSKKGTLKVQ